TILWNGSYVRVPTSTAASVVRQFATTFNNDKLTEAAHKISQMDIRSAAPLWFFTNGRGSSQGFAPEVTSVEVVGQLMRLDLRNLPSKTAGTLWIDRQERKLVRSVVDGQEMDITKINGGVLPTGQGPPR